MSTIKDFEDLEIWQMARAQSLRIYILLRKTSFEKEFEIKNQMKKSCGSVMDNIAEGFERETSSEFKRFLYISKASVGELRSQLYLSFDLNYISKDKFEELYQSATDISKMLSGLIKYLNHSNL